MTATGYYFIDVTWKTGFKHTIPCRGYRLKSQFAALQGLFWVSEFLHYEVTKEQYYELMWGVEASDPEPKKRKPKDGNVSKPERSTKARPTAKASKKASTKVTGAKGNTKKVGKQDGKLSTTPNQRKSRSRE